jgi:CPA1 family monovalent cation:H+ antiporter
VHDIYLSVIGLFGLLSIAVLMLPLSRRLNIPYTVIVTAAGIIIGLVIAATGPNGSLGGSSGTGAHNGGSPIEGIPIAGEILLALGSFTVTSEVILFVFLPVLIFESALAIVGVAISTVIVGGTMHLLTGTALIACLLLGAIVSATDPVAVVAIFKELAAPRRLGILVEGESLFNDATSIVIYNILLAMLLGLTQATPLSGVLSFLEVFLGGAAVGYILARAMCWLVGHLRQQTIVEVTLTIALAYIAFVVAEHFLHVSGVMATLTAGLVLGSIGRTRISGGSWATLTETWENIGFWANSLIFIMVGIAVPAILADASITALWALAGVIAAATAARAVLIYGLLPSLKWIGRKVDITRGYQAVMLWGGLRGAVSLALALAIAENANVAADTQNFILTLVTGLVLFTLFINATTIRYVMSYFGLDALPAADRVVQNRAMIRAISDVRQQITEFARDHRVKDAIVKPLQREYDARIHLLKQDIGDAGDLSDADWLKVGLSTITAHEKQIYLDLYREGFLSARSAQTLLRCVEDMNDALRHDGPDAYATPAASITRFPNTFLLALAVHRRLGLGAWLSASLAERFETLRACHATIEDLRSTYVPRLEGMIGGPETVAAIDSILAERLRHVAFALDALNNQYPDYAKRMEERSLGQVAVRVEAEDYDQMERDGLVSPEIYRALEDHLAHTSRKFERRPPLDIGLRPLELVGRVPLFTDLSETDKAEIASMLKPRLAIPGEMICHKGDTGHEMYFISSGTLEVKLDQGDVQLNNGDYFGELSLLRAQPRNADVVANGFCDLLILRKRDFDRLLEENAAIREHVYEIAADRLK